jgi:hypothetical protein
MFAHPTADLATTLFVSINFKKRIEEYSQQKYRSKNGML